MTPRIIRTITIVTLALYTALPAWGQQQFLYTPQPVPADHDTALQDGILVQEIVIRKGDTLSRLSRKYSGRGMYYPQILLFNSIKNPDLIYSGHTLRVPVSKKVRLGSGLNNESPAYSSSEPGLNAPESKGEQQKRVVDNSADSHGSPNSPAPDAAAELVKSELNSAGKSKSKSAKLKRKSSVRAKKDLLPVTAAEPQPAASKAPPTEAAGAEIFEAATKAYRRDDCRSALELLDRFLANHPSSPNAAEADLYKAECYLKLSAQ